MMRRLLVLAIAFTSAYALDSSSSDLILGLFTKFKRPFAVLDLLNDDGQIAHQLVGHCTGCYVLVCSNARWDGDIPSNLVMLDYDWNLRTLRSIERCEDFDVVLVDLASPVAQVAPQKVVDYCSCMGMVTVLINVPESIRRRLATRVGACVAQNVVVLIRKQRELLRAFFDDPRSRHYRIKSTFDIKLLHKKRQVVPWIPGINLCTFIKLHGVLPTRQQITTSLYQQFRLCNQDPKAANVIVCGDHVRFIDTVLDSRWTFDKRYLARLKRFSAIFDFMGVVPAGIDYRRLSVDDLATLNKYFNDKLPHNFVGHGRKGVV